jgi:hypothetical protein
MVSDIQLENIVVSNSEAGSMAGEIVTAVNAHGAIDNFSLVVAIVRDDPARNASRL